MERKTQDFEVVASYLGGAVEKRSVVTAETREEAAMQAVIVHALPIDYIKGVGHIYWNDSRRGIQRSTSKDAWPKVVSLDGDEVILAWGNEDSARTLLVSVREAV